ncbi:MAG TPA: molybdenum cofactor guanylyltransferase [Gemmatimonadales bacterium]|nr:molybdenum cofactor guanylyltransferase [Gemmatimonadales bacterium]
MNGAILAGGKASRFSGRPKGLELVGDRPIVARVADALLAATGQPALLVANDPEASAWLPGHRVAGDLEQGQGPLRGIQAAVLQAPAPVLCVAWDMPFVPAGLLKALADGLAQGFDAFLPASPGPRGFEPLCAAYGPGCAGPIAAALARGEREMVSFHPAIKVGILPAAAVGRWGDPEVLFLNVNSPVELEKADALWRESFPSSA